MNGAESAYTQSVTWAEIDWVQASGQAEGDYAVAQAQAGLCETRRMEEKLVLVEWTGFVPLLCSFFGLSSDGGDTDGDKQGCRSILHASKEVVAVLHA